MDITTQSDEEEEILVYAEFEDSVNIKQYRNINILGVDGNTPIAQLDDTFFSGTYQAALGTYMFFEEDPTPESLDPLFDKLPEKNLKYVGKTRKLIKMDHAYVTSNENKEHGVKKEVGKTVVEIPTIKFKTVQEAIDQFKIILSTNSNTNPSDIIEAAETQQCKRKSPSSRMKTKTLEDAFQELNRKYGKIIRQERINNNTILYTVLEKLLKLMRTSDKLFDSMKPKLTYMGSYFDGLRVGHPSEFDINVVLKIPVDYDKIVLDSTDTEYDYTYILMPSEFRRLYKIPMTAEKGFKKTVMWCDSNHRLSVTKFRSWMQSVVDAALVNLPVGNGKHILEVGNKSFGVVSKLAGPANNLTIYDETNVIDIDLVPTFEFELPKVPINCRVDFTKPEFNSIKVYYVVPKPSSDNFSWRLSFPFQERLIIENKNNLKSVVRLIKLLRDVEEFTKLASYYIKTLFLWEASASNDIFWKKKSLSYLVLYMLTKLRDALVDYKLSNYWCPDHNLLVKIKAETCTHWSNRLTKILMLMHKSKKNNSGAIIDIFRQSHT